MRTSVRLGLVVALLLVAIGPVFAGRISFRIVVIPPSGCYQPSPIYYNDEPYLDYGSSYYDIGGISLSYSRYRDRDRYLDRDQYGRRKQYRDRYEDSRYNRRVYTGQRYQKLRNDDRYRRDQYRGPRQYQRQGSNRLRSDRDDRDNRQRRRY